MKILFDYQIFERQRFGGISRYFFEIISQLDKDQTMDWQLPILYSNNHYLSKIQSIEKNLRNSPVLRPDPFDLILKQINFNKIKSIKERFIPSVENKRINLNKRKSIEMLKKGDFDVFHPTYYDDYFLEFIGSKPYVLTVYDLIHQIFPELFLTDAIDKNREMIVKANKIIAISENTKRDLIAIYGIEENKVVVTHLATSLNPKQAVCSSEFRNVLPEKYLLFVGDRHGYKNFFIFAQAFAIVAEREKDLFIVCTGSMFESHELNFFKKLKIHEKVCHYSVDDNELAFLYKKAIAFVFPSMYEGFGIPVLEAFSCECPVLLANSSSLSEIGGNAVIYFEPKNITTLIKAIELILCKTTQRYSLIRKGLSQLQQFSWEKNFRETKEIYKAVAGSKP